MGPTRHGPGHQQNYEGQYVAISSSGDGKVIASGRKFGNVFDSARKQGEVTPTVVFVPKDDGAYFY